MAPKKKLFPFFLWLLVAHHLLKNSQRSCQKFHRIVVPDGFLYLGEYFTRLFTDFKATVYFTLLLNLDCFLKICIMLEEGVYNLFGAVFTIPCARLVGSVTTHCALALPARSRHRLKSMIIFVLITLLY